MKLVIYILLFSTYAHAQIKNPYTLAENNQMRNSDTPSDERKPTPSSLEPESLNDELSKALNQQFNKIKSACEEEKNLDQKVADVKEGLYNLGILIKKYLPQENRLSIRHNLLLSEIDNILFSGMVFRGEFTKQAVQEDNIANTFISYYKFMHNLGDSIGMQDFKQQWAKDIAQGLSCLYPQ